MSRGGFGRGPTTEIPVPAALQQYFDVTSFTVHGRGRHAGKKKHHLKHTLHGRGRHGGSPLAGQVDPWGHKGMGRGGRHR